MKFLILLSLLITLPVFAKCKVYGISDSPQKLNCSMEVLQVKLTCRWNNYYVNGEKVNLAFHMEVEEGATPLVFKTNSGKTLTVLPESTILAEFDDGKAYYQGSCTR